MLPNQQGPATTFVHSAGSEKIPISGWYKDIPVKSTLDDVRIEKWIDQLETNEAARNDRRKSRQKMWKVDKKIEGVKPDPLTLAIHARRKHWQNSRVRESVRDRMEFETGRHIIDDVDEQYEDEPNSITVTGEEWWMKYFGLTGRCHKKRSMTTASHRCTRTHHGQA